jgi:hypothetical protein
LKRNPNPRPPSPQVLGPALGDVIVGALSGAGVLAAACGLFMPILGYCLGSKPHLVSVKEVLHTRLRKHCAGGQLQMWF